MGRVLTNNLAFAYAAESTPGTLPGSPTWKSLEPNRLTKFGADVKTKARRPIGTGRGTKKGAPIDLDSSVEFESDITVDAIEDFIEAFMFSSAVNAEMVITPSAVTGTEYTIPAASSTIAGKLQYGATAPQSLIYAHGFSTAGNNGLKVLTADTGTTDTTVTCSGLTAEASPPSNARIELAGIRGDTSDLSITVSGTTASITSGNGGGTAMNFTTLGLTVGQFIHVGGLTTTNQFANGKGYGRITAIAAGTLSLDKINGLATDTGSTKKIDLLFGRFIRDVNAQHANYIERTYTFELTSVNLDNPSGDLYEYANGNYANQVQFVLPVADLATMNLAFVGLDTPVPTDTRKTGASTPIATDRTTAFATATNIGFITTDAIPDGAVIFKNLTLTINNNVSPEKALGTLGAVFVNAGVFEVKFEGTAVFTDQNIIAAIRNNTTLTFHTILVNENGAVAVDMPSLTLGGGARDYPENQSVTVGMTGEVFDDDTFGFKTSVSLFPTVPTA